MLIWKNAIYWKINDSMPNTYTFETTEVETERIRAFMKEHERCQCRTSEKFAVSFIPTMLGGDIVLARCLACGEMKEVTEMEKF